MTTISSTKGVAPTTENMGAYVVPAATIWDGGSLPNGTFEACSFRTLEPNLPMDRLDWEITNFLGQQVPRVEDSSAESKKSESLWAIVIGAVLGLALTGGVFLSQVNSSDIEYGGNPISESEDYRSVDTE